MQLTEAIFSKLKAKCRRHVHLAKPVPSINQALDVFGEETLAH
jgi:hypothetical protein